MKGHAPNASTIRNFIFATFWPSSTDVTFIHAENQKPGAQAEIAKAAAIAQIQEHASASVGSVS